MSWNNVVPTWLLLPYKVRPIDDMWWIVHEATGAAIEGPFDSREAALSYWRDVLAHGGVDENMVQQQPV